MFPMTRVLALVCMLLASTCATLLELHGDSNGNILHMKRNAVPAKTYTLNLDLPPMERWKDIMKNADVNAIRGGIEKLLKGILSNSEVLHLVQKIAADLDFFIPQPFSDEMRGISQATGIPLGDIVLANIVYDLSAFGTADNLACTSIVTTDQSGRIIQGRNLDYNLPDFLRQVTAQVDFQRGGKSLFMATTYMTYVGVITGCKPGAFSISGDERDSGSWFENLVSSLRGSQITFFDERRILERASSYKSALQMAVTTPTIAPVYFILGGLNPGEGAIVVRNARTLANVTRLGENPKHPWFIVETNYDPWKSPPSSDDRRDAAIKSMDQIGSKNMSAAQLYKVLSMAPVFNSNTTYTTVMSAADSSVYHTMIRFDHP